MNFDELDKKMRVYEQSIDQSILPELFMVARLDGRNFSRLTKEICNFEAPFDVRFRDMMVNTVKKLNKAGITIIMVSHNADAIAECAERILIFDNTKLIKDAPAAKVFADSKTLKNIGLEVNGAKYLADLLKKRGMCIDDKLYRYEEIVKAVAEKIKNAGVGK